MTSDLWSNRINDYSHLSVYQSPHSRNRVLLLKEINSSNLTTLPCTLVKHAIYSAIEDLNELYHTSLSTDLTIATKIQGHAHHSSKEILDKILVPLKTGDR